MTVLLVVALALLGLVTSPLVLAAIDRAPGDEPLLDDVRGRGPRPWRAATPGRRRAGDAVATLHAGLWAAAGWRFGFHLPLVVYLAFFSTVLILAVVDIDTYLLPNRITYPAVAGSSVAIVVVSIVSRDDAGGAVAGAAVGAVGWSVFLLVLLVLFQAATGRDGLGLGDVKLAALLGLHVGWIHPALVIPALFVAGLAGLVAGLVALVARSGENRPYPFGPWLAVGAVVVVLASGPLLDALGV